MLLLLCLYASVEQKRLDRNINTITICTNMRVNLIVKGTLTQAEHAIKEHGLSIERIYLLKNGFECVAVCIADSATMLQRWRQVSFDNKVGDTYLIGSLIHWSIRE